MGRRNVLETIIKVIKQGTGDKDAAKGLGEVKRSANDANKDTKNLGGSLNGLIKKLGATAIAAISFKKALDFTKEVALLAARVTTLGVVTTQLGRNIGITEPEMRKIEESIQQLGITTQASRQAVATMIESQIDLANATELARLAQDAAVIANTNSSDAFERLVYVIQTGNVRMARTIGLNARFGKAQEDLASQLGKTVDGLSDTEIIQARVNAVMDAGSQISGTYSAAMQTAGKQLGSMDRLIEQTKLNIGELTEGPFSKLIFQVNKWLEAELEANKAQDMANELIQYGIVTQKDFNRISEDVRKGLIDTAEAHRRYNTLIEEGSKQLERLKFEAASADRALAIVGGTANEIPPEVSTTVSADVSNATKSLDEVLARLVSIQSGATLTVQAGITKGLTPDQVSGGGTVRTTGSGGLEGKLTEPGFQHGGTFTVPPGFPNDSFPVRVSSGERVTVQSKDNGQSQDSGQTRASAPLIGTVNITRDIEGQALVESMTRAARRL